MFLTSGDFMYTRLNESFLPFPATFPNIVQGKWVRVKVNDQLPVNEHNQLLLVRSAGGDELWPSILEKAYAKYYKVRRIYTCSHIRLMTYEIVQIIMNTLHARED
jgi:hypothetical protein